MQLWVTQAGDTEQSLLMCETIVASNQDHSLRLNEQRHGEFPLI